MLNKNFYPTPDNIIYKMLSGVDRKLNILDPSAGNGKILDALKRPYQKNLYAIENDVELQAILRDKGYKVIDSDFLNYSGHHYFSYIIMNPPFDNGVKHILKAWDIIKGGTIKCLLNSETLNNPYTQDRQRLLHIIEQYGHYENLGQCFRNAERKTNVDVSLVTLIDTREKESFRLNFKPDTAHKEENFAEYQERGLAPSDTFERYEAQYNAAINVYKKLLQNKRELEYHLKSVLPDGKSIDDILKDSFSTHRGYSATYSNFVETTTSYAWDNLFYKSKLRNVTTRNVKNDIVKLQELQGQMSFTSDNMHDLFYTLAASKDTIMIECILEVFDYLTKYYKNNREYVDGWKTNASYRVGKFILPDMLNWGRVGYDSKEKLADIEKSLCFISGKKYEKIHKIEDEYKEKNHFGEWRISEFFHTKLFQKGTMHFKWRDKKLCDDFNQIVAEHKPNWIPEKTKWGVYE